MASPSMTFNAQANVRSSAALAASGSATYTVDASTKFAVQLQFKNSNTGTTVGATNGLQVSIFRLFGGGPTADTIAVTQFIIATVSSTTNYQSIELGTGKYQVKVQNLDTANQIDAVEITSSTVDSIA